MQKRNLAILGSTGSIGIQTLEVVREHADLFQVALLSAHNQWQRLVEQAREFMPSRVVITNENYYLPVRDALANTGIEVCAGPDALYQLVTEEEIQTVVVAIVGFAGLIPTLRAAQAGKILALANKEALVVAGGLLLAEAKRYNATVLPVDSEHSAIFQCLAGELSSPDRLYITASGGPFKNLSLAELATVKPLDALKHPTWNMGAKISIDSATLMNKGLEVIEAHWLFDMPYDQIEVLVHPQCLVHSMVRFPDGSIKAQLGPADMRVPIQYAIAYPYRLPLDIPKYQFGPAEALTFEQPDLERFRCLSLALEAGQRGGTAPCSLNAANEIAVKGYLQGDIGFLDIAKVVERVGEMVPPTMKPSLDDYVESDREARKAAAWVIDKLKEKVL